MEILTQFWWIAVAVAVALVAVRVHRSHVRKRKAAQYRADESTIINIYNDFRSDDIRVYKDLPNRQCRLDWLKRHYPEFMEAANRHFSDAGLGVEYALASHLDLRLIKGAYEYESHNSALLSYHNATSRKSLNEYQVELDESNAQQAKWEELEAQAEAKRRAEQRERRAKEEAADKLRKNVAKTYWKSLSKEEKESFKKAKGKNARKRALPSSASTGYSLDTLYPLIMATQFSSINSDTGSSIDYCESPSYGHSSHSNHGSSHSYSDHGSSHSHSDSGSSFSSSDSGGGDGGGGGGGD